MSMSAPVYIGTKVSPDQHKQLRLLAVEAELSLSSFLLSLCLAAIAATPKQSVQTKRVKPYSSTNA